MVKESGGVMNSFFDEIIADARYHQGLSKEEATRAKSLMQNSVATSLVVGLSIALLIKVGFYGGIMGYFWSDDIKKIFGEDSLSWINSAESEVPLAPSGQGPSPSVTI